VVTDSVRIVIHDLYFSRGEKTLRNIHHTYNIMVKRILGETEYCTGIQPSRLFSEPPGGLPVSFHSRENKKKRSASEIQPLIQASKQSILIGRSVCIVLLAAMDWPSSNVPISPSSESKLL